MSRSHPVISESALTSRLFSHGAAAAFGRFAGMGTQFACYALLAKMLTPRDFGIYIFASSIAVPISSLATIGVTRAAVRFVAENLVRGAVEDIRATLRLTLAYGMGAIAIASLLSWGIGWCINQWQSGEMALPATLLGIWVASLSVGQLFAETVRGFHEVRVSSWMLGQGGGPLAGLIFAVVLLGYSTTSAPTLGAAFWATIFSHLCIAPLALAWLAWTAWRHDCSLLMRGSTTEGDSRSSTIVYQDVLNVSLPVMLAQAFAFVVVQGDIWIGYFVLNEASVGLLGAARRLAAVALVPNFLANLAVMPLIPDLRARKQPQQLERILRASAGWASLLALLVLVPMVVCPSSMLEWVYRPYFREAAPLLVISALGYATVALSGSSSLVLTLTGHQMIHCYIQLGCGLFLLIVGLLVSQVSGVTGLTVVGSSALALSGVLSAWAVGRYLGISSHAASPWKMIAHRSTR